MVQLQEVGHSGFAQISDIIATLAYSLSPLCPPYHFSDFLNYPLDEGEVNTQMSWFLKRGISQTSRYFNLAVGFILDDTSTNV